ncbi:MAG TPA: cation:proton antiporter [Kofleriaceae bacterium]
MTGSHVLIELVVVLGTAAFVTVVFQALRLPVVLGYVLAGLVIGPHVPVPLVANAGLVHILSELGVILLMFTIGLELRLSTIVRVGMPAALTALFEVGLVIAVGTLIAGLLGFSAQQAVFAGACLGISSTMLVAKAFEELGWKGGFTEAVFAILVFEDLIAIVLLAVLAGVANGSGLDARDLAILLGKLGGFLALMMIVGLIVVPRGIKWISKRARVETLLITALALCFGMSALASEAGYSVALGAFVAGILIAESGQGHDVFELVKPFRDLFAMVFFVSVGMTIIPGDLLLEAPRILALTAVVLVVKPIGVAIGVFLSGHGVQQGVRAGLSLAAIGELSFVIANVAGGGTLLTIAVGVSVVTTFVSPLLIHRSERVADWVSARLPKRLSTFISFYDAWFARLRARPRTTWRKVRRPVIVLVFDLAVTIAIIIASATLGPDLLADVGMVGYAADALLIAIATIVASPFAIGLIRRVGVIAGRLAAEVIPVGEPVDLGRAPRRALIITFELAMALAIAVPAIALIQPFVPASPLLVIVIAFVLIVLMRKSMADFEGHVRAGSEVILEMLAQKDVPLAQSVETILPGFGGMVSVVVPTESVAVGHSLAELDLRAKTGATVLAIGRGASGLATPSPTEPLRAGDVLALAGSTDAVTAARTMIEATSITTSEHHGP